MPITRSDAERIARDQLQARYAGRIAVALLDRDTQEHDLGWVFFHESQEFIDTGQRSSRLAGAPPLVVDREGDVHWLPTSAPSDVGLDALRAKGIGKNR